ncbi:MAG: twin-arginine translocase subunit TatB [Mesorhizobium amorphae]|nr:MAG: twin-arginine translocase subunit TatB [Mesorhizobium amorphae]
MFEIGWTEMLVIAVVMIVVVGPKDLPQMLRQFGRTTAKLRAMAGDFRKQFDEALKDAELDDVKKSIDTIKGFNPTTEVRKQLNPFEKAAQDVRSGLDNAMRPKPSPPPVPASTEAQAAEPLKTGTVERPAAAVVPDAEPAAASAAVPAVAEPAPVAPVAAVAEPMPAAPVVAVEPVPAAPTPVAPAASTEAAPEKTAERTPT